jgi:hypothetical protein
MKQNKKANLTKLRKKYLLAKKLHKFFQAPEQMCNVCKSSLDGLSTGVN